jgi:RNA polymerase sigma factor (sigma-70 family)
MDEASRAQLQDALKRLSVDRTDEDAWRFLFEQSWATALTTSNRVLRGQLELARDVAQEAFHRIVRYCKFADLLDPDDFFLYLKAVCRNAARDALKDLTAEALVESAEEGELEEIRVSEETPENLISARETLNEFRQQLDESDRKMLNLLIEGFDLPEIADRLTLSYSNAGVRVHRLRERLRNYSKTREMHP